MEAYWLWHSGYKWELDRNDIALLNSNTQNFEAVSVEKELIFRYYKLPDVWDEGKYHTASDIISNIDIKTKQKLSHVKVGMVLAEAGVNKTHFKRNGVQAHGYKLIEVSITEDLEEKQKTDTSVKNDQKVEKSEIDLLNDRNDDCPF